MIWQLRYKARNEILFLSIKPETVQHTKCHLTRNFSFFVLNVTSVRHIFYIHWYEFDIFAVISIHIYGFPFSYKLVEIWSFCSDWHTYVRFSIFLTGRDRKPESWHSLRLQHLLCQEISAREAKKWQQGKMDTANSHHFYSYPHYCSYLCNSLCAEKRKQRLVKFPFYYIFRDV